MWRRGGAGPLRLILQSACDGMGRSRAAVRAARSTVTTEGNLMRSLICAVSMMGLLVIAGIVSQKASAVDDEPASIEKIMESLHKGRKSPFAILKTALKSASPDWAVIQKESKTYAKYAPDLPKNDPPKGDKESFKRMAKAFADSAKKLEGAAEKEDLAAARSAFHKIGTLCKSCHDAHKEEE
jgi:cytochrome c556